MNQGIAKAIGLAFVFFFLSGNLWGQFPNVTPEMIKNMSPEDRQKFMQMQAKQAGRPNGKPGGPGGKDGKEGEKKDKDGKPAKGDENKKDDTAKPIKRPEKPETPFDPKTLPKQLDKDRTVGLNVQGAPWLAVINWLGEISNMSVDWQELPGDFVNLRTQRKYKVEEWRNIINRHLLARGYTILINGEMLTVEKIASINASLVPRIEPSQLDTHLPFEYAKSSFPLKSLIAQEIVKELQPMASKNGKITALGSTNRIEVMDAVANLQDIHRLLKAEQSGAANSQSVKEFVLENVTAPVAAAMLRELMGLDGPSSGGGGSMQAMMQAQMARMQRGQPPQQGKQKPGAGAQQKPKPTIVVNERRNSIIASATPDKMAVIEQGIRLLDVSNPETRALDRYLSRLRTYRLVSLDPKDVVEILQDTGVMDPTTTLKINEKSKSIIANAPPWDHLTIDKMIKRLDGAAREFRVVRLRRRRADQVATTIETLMIGNEEDDNQSNRYRYFGYFSRQDDKDKDKFRVAADIEHNWLLVWCNQIEYDKVLALLEELGEVTNRAGDQMRVLENFPADIDPAALDRLRRAFQQMAPNQLNWEIEAEEKKKDEKPDAEEKTPKKDEPKKDEVASGQFDQAVETLLAMNDQLVQAETFAAGDNETADPQAKKYPALRVLKDPNGRVMIESQDSRAMDLFEELAAQILNTRKDYTVFKVEHASPTWVALTLEEFFAESDEDDGNNRFPFYYFGMNQQKDDKPIGLGDRPKLLFVADFDSKSIVVRNATTSQLQTIRELIELYDIPEPLNTERARYTRMLPLKYARATDVAETVKGAFADLLSKNDEAFRNKDEKKRREGQPDAGQNQKPPNSPSSVSSLQGKLAIGINEPSNLLVISTKGEKLMEVVTELVKKLDEKAMENDVTRVVRIKSATPNDIHRTLLGLIGETQKAEEAEKAAKEQQQGKDQPRENPRPQGERGNGQPFRERPNRR